MLGVVFCAQRTHNEALIRRDRTPHFFSPIIPSVGVSFGCGTLPAPQLSDTHTSPTQPHPWQNILHSAHVSHSLTSGSIVAVEPKLGMVERVDQNDEAAALEESKAGGVASTGGIGEDPPHEHSKARRRREEAEKGAG